MKIYFFIVLLVSTMTQRVLAQQNIHAADHKQENDFPSFGHALLLETKADTTANISAGDLDGDGHLDILLVKGRHWPIVDRVLLGNGLGGIRKAYNLGKISDRSYTGGLADFNGDGSLDIAVSNDAPDRKLIYFNDGKGNFTIGSEFGLPEWATRNLSIADINGDGSPDLILANRGDSGRTSNYICLNNGKGQFNANCIPFAPYPTTTIAPADMNKDGFIDLVVPHRDGGQSYVYTGSADHTFSETRRIPFGPPNATIRVAAIADFNGDSIPDIVTIDEYKGVDLYFGQKNQTFSAGISLADQKIVPYALAVADLNNDQKADIIVGHIKAPSTVFFNNGTGHNFKSISFGDSKGTVYGFAVGDFNEDGIPDIAAARSEGTNILYFGNIRSKKRK
ncbi:Repeat domain-containing protein [Chitinophaga rupis]|uniref:Repeat domain-containing protein n=1 Tax=Chitinophaga rupis TaxID=573321 RepID=A0A1H7R5T6_9BACT|nr:VCBS repeat-containing protein [Chitinophaga rupis]SEL55636.1 Repeat domain-containing protein [Chitinophaga rupis]